ncbi:Uncharacterized protein TCAP_04220, partial [Tolypocladium capitatum]
MDASTSESFLIAVGSFAGFELLVTLVSILKKTSRPAGLLRVCAVVPFAIYGGIAIQGAFKQRYDQHGPIPKHGAVWLGQAIHGVVGIALIPWALVGGVVLRRSRKGHWPFTFKWEDRRRSSSGFYLAVVDGCYFVCVAVALACASSFTPWHVGQCDGYGIYDSWPMTDAGRAGECQRMLTVQIVALLVLQVQRLPFTTDSRADVSACRLTIACQTILVLPLLALPAPIRAQLFLVARALRFRRRPDGRDAGWHDLERAALHDAIRDEKATLAAMFREDAIATSLASHLHFDDVANVSRTSRTMRGARAQPPPDRRPPRALLRPLHEMLPPPAGRAAGPLLRDVEPARPVRPARRVLGRRAGGADGGDGA